MSWPDEVFESYTVDRCRFELLKIAFKHFIGYGQPQRTADQIGARCVEYADAAIAAMEKGPDAKDSEQRARKAGLENETVLAVLKDLRAEVEGWLNSDRQAELDNPTSDSHALGYRKGDKAAYQRTLRLFDRAIKKAKTKPETENVNQPE